MVSNFNMLLEFESRSKVVLPDSASWYHRGNKTFIYACLSSYVRIS